jgi:4-alpha-glucanotransferase
VPKVRAERSRATRRLSRRLARSLKEPRALLAELLEWLGRSESPLVVPWLEDFWLEPRGVNLPGTRSADRPNWQRPMRPLLDEIFSDPEVDALVRRLQQARSPA